MLTPSLRSSLLHRPSMLAKRRAMPITSRYRTLISPPSCADECPASGHRVSASPTALPGATAVSGNRSTSYGNVSSRSTKSWCTVLSGAADGTRYSRPRKRVRKTEGNKCCPGRRRGYSCSGPDPTVLIVPPIRPKWSIVEHCVRILSGTGTCRSLQVEHSYSNEGTTRTQCQQALQSSLVACYTRHLPVSDARWPAWSCV